MNNLADALRERIALLEDEEEELQDALGRIVARKEVLFELLSEEEVEEERETPDLRALEVPKPSPKRRGRPKGSKNKAKPSSEVPPSPLDGELEPDPIEEEARGMEGTPPEIAERLSKRRFHALPRPARDLGPGITVGTKKDVVGRLSGR